MTFNSYLGYRTNTLFMIYQLRHTMITKNTKTFMKTYVTCYKKCITIFYYVS